MSIGVEKRGGRMWTCWIRNQAQLGCCKANEGEARRGEAITTTCQSGCTKDGSQGSQTLGASQEEVGSRNVNVARQNEANGRVDAMLGSIYAWL